MPTPDQALAQVKPQTKADKFLNNLVLGHFETMKDAARAAGYTESSLTGTIYRVASSGHFKGKLAKTTRKRTDIALRIAGRAGEHLERALEKEEADPALVLAAWRESTRIVKEHGLTTQDLISPERRKWYVMKRYRLARNMLRLGMSLSPKASRVLTWLNSKLGIPEPTNVSQD